MEQAAAEKAQAALAVKAAEETAQVGKIVAPPSSGTDGGIGSGGSGGGVCNRDGGAKVARLFVAKAVEEAKRAVEKEAEEDQRTANHVASLAICTAIDAFHREREAAASAEAVAAVQSQAGSNGQRWNNLLAASSHYLISGNSCMALLTVRAGGGG